MVGQVVGEFFSCCGLVFFGVMGCGFVKFFWVYEFFVEFVQQFFGQFFWEVISFVEMECIGVVYFVVGIDKVVDFVFICCQCVLELVFFVFDCFDDFVFFSV